MARDNLLPYRESGYEALIGESEDFSDQGALFSCTIKVKTSTWYVHCIKNVTIDLDWPLHLIALLVSFKEAKKLFSTSIIYHVYFPFICECSGSNDDYNYVRHPFTSSIAWKKWMTQYSKEFLELFLTNRKKKN